jgi:DNA-binding winged helix-turn-helix (wHTH) protein/Tol biopolymer transport system component
MTTTASQIYQFGAFRFDATEGVLTLNGEMVPITPKAADVLRVLIERQGSLVPKEHLIREVWPTTFVEEGNLTFHVHLLRQILKDRKEEPQYIATVPRRGYRFIAAVTRVVAQPPPVPSSIPPGTLAGLARPFRVWDTKRWATVGGMAAVVVAIGSLLPGQSFLAGSRGPVSVLQVTQLTIDGRTKVNGEPILTDGNQLFFSRPDGYRARSVNPVDRTERLVFEGFRLLDISRVHGEALAIRPVDRGAQHALWALPLLGGTPRRLGQILVDTSAAWSRDGTRIAFVRSHALYVTDSAGATEERLRTFSGDPRALAWSPGDRFIRFTLTNAADRRNPSALWDVNVDGTGLRKVFADSGDHSNDCCGKWLDEYSYVFQARAPSGRQSLWLLRERSDIVGNRARDLIRLSPDSLDVEMPSPSLDGRRIFAVAQRAPQLSEYKGHANEFAPYLGGISAIDVNLSRDSRWITYLSEPDRILWRARSDGTQPVPLTPAPMRVDGSSWSPDGRWIAFRGRQPGQRGKIFLISAAGGRAEPLTGTDVEQGTPSWSPDGTRIAFGDVPETFGRSGGGERIHIYDRVRHITSDVPGSEGLWTSRWSPDGRYLAALTIEGQELMVFHFQTARWRSLNVPHSGEPVWSRDSRYLYCPPEGSESRFRRVRVADGVSESLVDLREQPLAWVGVALNGAPIISRTPTDLVSFELQRH